jgi:hypothetical protein
MGKPILLGVDGQAREIMDKFNSGIFFEPENTSHFMESVERMTKRSNDYAKMSDNSLNLAKAYDRRKLAVEMEKSLENL